MAVVPTFLLRHTATVEAYAGAGPHGDLYDPPATVRCFADETRRRVLNTTGAEVVSQLTLYCPPDTDVPTGSRVTVNGRASYVISVARRDGGGLPTPDHLEVACT